MKAYIENSLKYYNTVFKSPADVVHHMFAVLGNGVDLNNKGYINENYGCKEVYHFPKPEAFRLVYPWEDKVAYQPFRDLVGCRDIGFKEAAQYFIDCIKITPDSVENILKWKENIGVVQDVLLNTPTIKDEYVDIETGYTEFVNKLNCKSSIDNIQDGTKVQQRVSVSKRWFFDVQWSDCPDFVENEVRHLWGDYELGNDNYIVQRGLDEELFEEYPNIYFWLKHKGVQHGEEVIIHWWW